MRVDHELTARERWFPRMWLALAMVWVCQLYWSAASVHAAPAAEKSQLRERTYPVADVKAYSYRSKLMDRSYDVVVSVPADYAAQPQKKYPVLFVTDGRDAFEVTRGIWHLLAFEIDQPILVSIGSPLEDGFEASVERRVHEFSPPNWDMTNLFGQEVANELPSCKRNKQTCVGGAPKFFEFIASELVPELAKSYRIDGKDLGLTGHSAGGFFIAWSIFQGDSRFKRFIIGSPAMTYGDDEIFRREAQYAETHKDLPISVYVASGSLEMTDPALEYVSKIVSGHVHFGATLLARKYPGLKLYSEIHQNLGHSDVAPVVFARGLKLLYPKVSAAH